MPYFGGGEVFQLETEPKPTVCPLLHNQDVRGLIRTCTAHAGARRHAESGRGLAEAEGRPVVRLRITFLPATLATRPTQSGSGGYPLSATRVSACCTRRPSSEHDGTPPEAPPTE
eukprot:5881317-Prymnesium_polylepis.1